MEIFSNGLTFKTFDIFNACAKVYDTPFIVWKIKKELFVKEFLFYIV